MLSRGSTGVDVQAFADLTRVELRTAAPAAVVVVPLGSIEQHGPHLPVTTDTVVVHHIARRAAQLVADRVPVLVAPVLPFGFAEHHLHFGGTVSISPTTYLDLLTDIGTSLAESGVRQLFFLNGHGGNESLMKAAVDRLAYQQGRPLRIGGASYWTRSDADLTTLGIGPVPGHAGSFETSCMLAIAPELVQLDQRVNAEDSFQPITRVAVPGAVARHSTAWLDSDGRTDDARRASADMGAKALDILCAAVAEMLVEFQLELP